MKLTSHRDYSFITGVILFLVGFLGFAFRNSVNIGNGYLVGALILGFWGVVIYFKKE